MSASQECTNTVAKLVLLLDHRLAEYNSGPMLLRSYLAVDSILISLELLDFVLAAKVVTLDFQGSTVIAQFNCL